MKDLIMKGVVGLIMPWVEGRIVLLENKVEETETLWDDLGVAMLHSLLYSASAVLGIILNDPKNIDWAEVVKSVGGGLMVPILEALAKRAGETGATWDDELVDDVERTIDSLFNSDLLNRLFGEVK